MKDYPLRTTGFEIQYWEEDIKHFNHIHNMICNFLLPFKVFIHTTHYMGTNGIVYTALIPKNIVDNPNIFLREKKLKRIIQIKKTCIMRLAIYCKKENIQKISNIFNISFLPKEIYYDIILYVKDDNTTLQVPNDGQGFCDRFCGTCNVCKETNKYKYDKVTDDISVIRELKLKRILK